MEMDMNEDFDQDDEDNDEYKAPAFSWMMDYAPTESPKVDQPAPQPDIQKLLNDLIQEFTEQQHTNPKVPKKAVKHVDKNSKMCRIMNRHPRVQSRNGVRVGQPNPACRCH